MTMFRLAPWKKRSDRVAVRSGKPMTDAEHDLLPLTHLREEFDSLMDRFFEESRLSGGLFGNQLSLWQQPRFDWNWDLGWEDNEKEYVFHADLPGFESDDFDIQVSGNALKIRAEHKSEQKENGGASYDYGSFVRTMTLPHGVEADKIEARYHSGVLEVHLPKAKETAGRRIAVKSP